MKSNVFDISPTNSVQLRCDLVPAARLVLSGEAATLAEMITEYIFPAC
jgi:hypothetical protein